VKLELIVQNVVTGDSWTEEYDKPGIGDNGNTLQAEDWAKNLIDWFNNTCRAGESKRRLLGVKIIVSSRAAHDWYKRTDGMSVEFRGRYVDVFECRTCGITGKRFSLSGSIRRDSKFKAKKYESCFDAARGDKGK
jgi:hypothetical protein